MNTQKQIGLMVSLMFIMVASCAAYSVIDLPIRAQDQKEWHFKESVHRGALLYANNCRTCHGIRGEGFVGPAVNTPNFKNQDPLILAQNKAMIRRTLQCGRAGTLMPAWLNTNGGPLNARQIEHLVNFLTAPEDPEVEGATNHGWEQAVEFAHNLNHETALIVGGDTLGSIGRLHDVGIAEVLALNPGIRDPFAFLPKGTVVRLPASSVLPERDYEVEGNRENVARIVNSQNVDAMILADLNQIPYRVERGTFVIGGRPGVSEAGVGLYPGAELQLPGGAVYVVRPGDTAEIIAEQHTGLDARALLRLNADVVGTTDTAAELPSVATLRLPDNAVYIVQAGDTQAFIEDIHGLEDGALDGADITPGTTVSLPPDSVYQVQAEDTLAHAAAIHGITEAELAGLNDLEPGTPIRPEVVLALPEGASYIVQGQSLEDIRATLGGVTAADIGEAQEPPVPADHVYAIGTQLVMPPDAYGSAPPDARNPGTACVEHAVPASVFESIIGGGGGGSGAPEPPEEFSDEVVIQATQTVPEFDWIVIADGTEQAPNEGVVKIAPGTTVTFENVAGFHTITINGTKEGEDIGPQPETREVTFSEPGEFKITCDYHPAMLAWVFVEEPQ